VSPGVDLSSTRKARRPLLGRGIWTLTDQLLSSGTNFFVAIVLARVLGPDGFGAYAVAFSVWIVAMSASRGLIVQPFVVEASPQGREASSETAAHAAASCLGLGVLMAVPVGAAGLILGLGTAVGSALGFLAAALPGLCLQDFWRFVGFSRSEPRQSTVNDAIWAAVQGLALGALWYWDRLTPGSGVAAWGVGAATAAAFGIAQFEVRPRVSHEAAAWARQAFVPGKWFAMSSATHSAAVQGTVFIIAGSLGAAAVGGLRAAMNLVAPLQLLSMSADALGLPAASRAIASRRDLLRFCVLYSSSLTAIGLLYGSLIVPWAPALLSFVFGDAFEGFSPLVLPVALSFVASAVGMGASVGLRAMLGGRQLMAAQAISAPLILALVAIAAPRFGVIGAAWAITAGYTGNSALIWYFLVRLRGRQGPA
jgi:O-antigen/teichoic acid export membrane protein